jgi:hypothetical protein
MKIKLANNISIKLDKVKKTSLFIKKYFPKQ